MTTYGVSIKHNLLKPKTNQSTQAILPMNNIKLSKHFTPGSSLLCIKDVLILTESEFIAK